MAHYGRNLIPLVHLLPEFSSFTVFYGFSWWAMFRSPRFFSNGILNVIHRKSNHWLNWTVRLSPMQVTTLMPLHQPLPVFWQLQKWKLFNIQLFVHHSIFAFSRPPVFTRRDLDTLGVLKWLFFLLFEANSTSIHLILNNFPFCHVIFFLGFWKFYTL